MLFGLYCAARCFELYLLGEAVEWSKPCCSS